MTIAAQASTFAALCCTTACLAQIAVYDDRAAFLTETGGASATGPIPNLGHVHSKANPTGATLVGSVTISLATGGDTLAIGAEGVGQVIGGDWYPPSPSHDIALGWENLQFDTAAPVYALGFDMWEPDLTMPFWGGAPVDSTFEVILYSAGTQVGTFEFNVQEDADAFVGVWSAVPFDSMTLIDQTFSDDDEYFGEVYTGDTPLPAACYPDCDGDAALTLADFGCFQTAFGLGEPYADCDGDTLLTLADFGCFQTAFGLGCP